MNCPTIKEPICEQQINEMIIKPTLKDTFRKLFTDYAIYSFFYILNINLKLCNEKILLTKLIDNQKEIGDFIKPLIGEINGNELIQLLKEHVASITETINSIAIKDKIKMKDSIEKIYAVNCKLSKFFYSLNKKKLPENKILYQLNKHTQFLIDISILYLEKKYEYAFQKFDLYFNHILLISDTLCVAFTNEQKQTGGQNSNKFYHKYKKYKVKYLKKKNLKI